MRCTCSLSCRTAQAAREGMRHSSRQQGLGQGHVWGFWQCGRIAGTSSRGTHPQPCPNPTALAAQLCHGMMLSKVWQHQQRCIFRELHRCRPYKNLKRWSARCWQRRATQGCASAQHGCLSSRLAAGQPQLKCLPGALWVRQTAASITAAEPPAALSVPQWVVQRSWRRRKRSCRQR
jgi:hypothetical protein